MAEITDLNGKAVSSGRETRVILTYDHQTGHLALDGDLGHVDRVLNVLEQAKRYYEAVYRFQQGQLMAAQAQQERELHSMIARPH